MSRDFDHEADVSHRLYQIMNELSDYDALANILAAHAQRIICNTPNEDEKWRKLAEFNAACYVKVKWHADMAAGRIPQSPTQAKELLADMAGKFEAVH